MTIEKPDPFNLGMEIKVHPKNKEDLSGLDRAKEIRTQINKMAGFDLCGSITNTVQPCSKEPECVTFVAHNETKYFGSFVEQLKTKLGIDIQYKYRWGLKN